MMVNKRRYVAVLIQEKTPASRETHQRYNYIYLNLQYRFLNLPATGIYT